MEAILERSYTLKQSLTDFVLEAEGELAEALETYAAKQLRRNSGDNYQAEMTIDTFITEGRVADKSPIDLFIQAHPELPESDKTLINGWHRTVIGLFAVTKILPDGFELMNWLTAKQYIVKPNNPKIIKDLSRCKEGEIILTSIIPITDNYSTFSAPCTLMGKLGKPKLAIAIGNFKENYKKHLYSDAPDLLEQAWESVTQYHEQFVDFFGSDEITLTGYQLNKKIGELQEITAQKRLESAGIDTDKSFTELAQEVGVEESEIKAVAKEMGADSQTISQMLSNKNTSSKMVTPKIDLPVEIKKAEQVTALSHPRWGYMFLPNYSKIKDILEAENWQSIEGSEKFIRQNLEDKSMNTFVWHRLAAQYPESLEKILQSILQRPDFNLQNDIDALLQEFNKNIEPELPDIASVPVHLHNLFQDAVVEVNKSKPKSKGQKQVTKGFQRG